MKGGKKYTILVGMEGKIIDRVEWLVKSDEGLRILKEMVEHLFVCTQMSAKADNKSFDISIDDGRHELLFEGCPYKSDAEVFLDGRATGRKVIEASEELSKFIGAE